MDKERLEILAKGLKTEFWPRVETGGQSVGVMPRGLRMWYEEMGFDFRFEGGRSQIKNKLFAIAIFELFCEEFYP